jgi:hypothetical protein
MTFVEIAHGRHEPDAAASLQVAGDSLHRGD